MARIYPNQLEPGSDECRTCLGVGRIRDGETNELRKCLDCAGSGNRPTLRLPSKDDK